MGCHTCYQKPLVKGKENVKTYLKEKLESVRKKSWFKNYDIDEINSIIDDLNESTDTELLEDIELIDGDIYFINDQPVIYVECEFSPDKPRINGYPEDIIKSADEMFSAMENGLINCRGERVYFDCDKNDEEIKKVILYFFHKYPDGIITFG